MEYLIPVVPPIAGIKLGLGNIAVLAAMVLLDSDSLAAGIMLTKVTMTALLFSGFGGFAYSLAGGVASLAVMMAVRRCGYFSAAGVSCAGGAAHMAAQAAVAAGLTSTPEVLYLLPLLTAVGTATGILNGIIVNLSARRLKKYIASQGIR
ncbi:MAG: Gx transporter family protein [Clostridia bacterium]|nr:Gx transporter family protein [Clostridia bacterium]